MSEALWERAASSSQHSGNLLKIEFGSHHSKMDPMNDFSADLRQTNQINK